MNKIDLLIVGAGPVGLTLAVEARRYGIPFRIIDKAAQRSDKSKALAIWSGTQEALAGMGVLEKFLNFGIKVHGVRMCDSGHTLMRNDAAEGVESHYPRPIIVPQSETERLLEERLAADKDAIERSTELISIAEKSDHVECLLSKPDGTQETVSARYVAACDGARSAVRKSFNVEFPGITEDMNFILIDCAIDGGDLKGDEITITWGTEGGIAFFPVTEGVWRIFAERTNHADTSDPTLEEMQAKVDNSYPNMGAKLRDPKWLAFFRVNERVAAQFCLGRTFLLGDAAHIHSPAGGQGMNTGMQDAANLAWKLALLLKGAGDSAEISRSYYEEREPVAKMVVKGATQKLHLGMTKGVPIRILKDIALSLLIHIPAFRQSMTHELSELYIRYESSLIDASAPWPDAKSGFASGTRPRDVLLKNPDGMAISLWERFLQPKHTLLLFSGENPDESTDATVRKLIDHCLEMKGHIEPILIWHGSSAPVSIPCECLLDPMGDGHRRYGAKECSWYLIRPDQYAAARCQPAEAAPLERYIAKVLKT